MDNIKSNEISPELEILFNLYKAKEAKRIEALKAKGFPEAKYHYGNKVSFYIIDDVYTGSIEIVDRYGTFEQNEEPSYDIMVDNFNGEQCLIKHVRQSSIID